MLPAQAPWAAERGPLSVWAGVEISTFNPDFACTSDSPFSCGSHQLLGIAPFVEANHLVFTKLGVEGEARFANWRGPGNGLSERSFLAGPTYDLFRWKRMQLRGRVLFGDAHIDLPKGAPGSGGDFFAFSPGASANFRITRRVAVRGDYEYQFWPSFEGVPTSTTTGKGGLTPNGFSAGVSYAIIR